MQTELSPTARRSLKERLCRSKNIADALGWKSRSAWAREARRYVSPEKYRAPGFGWRKFLSIEDEFLFLEKIAQIVDDRLTELDDRSKEVAA